MMLLLVFTWFPDRLNGKRRKKRKEQEERHSERNVRNVRTARNGRLDVMLIGGEVMVDGELARRFF